MSDTLIKRFNDTALARQGKCAITFKKGDAWADISYIELKRAIDGLSGFLSKEGIGKNDKVVIILKNRPEWPEIFFAAVSLGAIAVPVNPDAEIQEIVRILNDSGARLVFLGNESHHLEAEITNRCASVKKVISADSPLSIQALKTPPGSKAAVEVSSDDTACILYTSGTTNDPKGVMLSHANFLSNADSIRSLNIITSDEKILSMLPLHHIYPLTVTMIIPLIFGGAIVYPKTIHGEGLLEAMSRTNPTAFVAVPQIFYIFHQKMGDALKKVPFPVNALINSLSKIFYTIRVKTGINLSRVLFKKMHTRFGKSMRLFVSGGAKLDEKVERDLLRFGFTILEGYGLTETSPILTLNPPGKIRPGSAGLTIPGVTIKIDSPDEKGVGEVAARGANVMKGYYKRDDLTAQVLKDGWFYTGDLGYIDKDGYLFLTGRSKELIVLSSGLKVYPDEIERIYAACALVKEICIFEAPAGRGLEGNQVLWAVVVPNIERFKKESEANLREVIKANFDNIQAALPAHKRIMGFVITLEPLPRTLLGKLRRFVVKEKYLPSILKEGASSAGEVRPVSGEDKKLLETDLAKKVIAYLAKSAPVKRDVLPQDSLELDLGIDSLGRIELAAGLEKLLNVKIGDEAIGTAFVVRDLINNLKGLVPDNAAGNISEGNSQEAVREPDYWARILETPPNEENRKKLDMRPGFRSKLVYSLVRGLCFLIFKLFYRLKVEGKERIPKKGPYIIFANHTSFFDGALVGVAMPRYAKYDVFFLSFRKYFNAPVLRNLIKACRIIPLDFFSHLAEPLRSVYYVLKNGKGVCIFPEGRISLDGEVKNFKKGFGIIIKETHVTLVPIVIKGAHEAWPRTAKLPHPHPIKVTIGEPISYRKLIEEAAGIKASDEYEALSIAARRHLLTLQGKKDTFNICIP